MMMLAAAAATTSAAAAATTSAAAAATTSAAAAATTSAAAAATTSAAAAAKTSAGDPRLITAALVGIGVVVVLITVAKVHPFLALILGATTMGVIAGLGLAGTLTGSFTTGVGATTGSVGLLVALGAMIGGLLTESGGATKIVDTITENVSEHRLPWAMAGLAALIGLPLFFEIGVVLLVPVVLLVSRRAGTPVLRVGIPALAGLSVLHGLVPPHPGPVAAISALHADLGLTLAFGLIIAVPTVIIAGPVFGSFIVRYIDIPAPVAVGKGRSADDGADDGADDALSGEPKMGRDSAGGPSRGRAPAFWPAVGTILVPIVMMLVGAIGELTLKKGTHARSVFDVLGTPVIALTVGVIVAMFVLGYFNGFSRAEVGDTTGRALPPIAGILLIVAAGGGFKQVLVDAGVGNVIANAAKGASLSPLLLGWLVAVGIRVATGSATVATITAAGIVSPLAAGLDKPTLALLALAVGCGSLFFSHVNDAGFWLVKEYFGMSVGQTLASWSVMETIVSVVGFLGVLLLHLVV